MARALDVEISYSLVLLQIFLAGAVLFFLNRPRRAFIAGYAVFAIVASHFIVDARKGASIGNIARYPWSNLVLDSLALTLLGFALLQFTRLTETYEGGTVTPVCLPVHLVRNVSAACRPLHLVATNISILSAL